MIKEQQQTTAESNNTYDMETLFGYTSQHPIRPFLDFVTFRKVNKATNKAKTLAHKHIYIHIHNYQIHITPI